MAVRNDFYYQSSGKGMIHAVLWEPKCRPVGVVQLVHGIAEHINRYEDYANFLTDHGFVVVGEDHMGHGQSLGEEGIVGYFHGGWFKAVRDVLNLANTMMVKYPDLPYFLFGHSMGSFMVRTVLSKYPSCGIRGAVICGTAWQGNGLLSAGIPMCKLFCSLEGEQKSSKKLQSIMFGSYNKKIKTRRTKNDWLTRDEKVVDQYNEDPMCGFAASAGLYRDMLEGIRFIQAGSSLHRMKKDLPVFFIAGGDDPVGNYGKGVEKAADKFRKAGMDTVELKIYPQCRHEILNELNKNEVYEDTLAWLQKWV